MYVGRIPRPRVHASTRRIKKKIKIKMYNAGIRCKGSAQLMMTMMMTQSPTTTKSFRV